MNPEAPALGPEAPALGPEAPASDPDRKDAPAFDEPWQAQAFALTVALNEAGHLPWSDWAAYFGRALADAGLKGSADPVHPEHRPQDNAAYYRAWLQALETLARDRGWALPLQLGARREAIRAYNNVAASPGVFRSK